MKRFTPQALWKQLLLLLPWRRRAAERDMRDELRTLADIAGPRALGNLTLAAEDARAEWGWTRLEQLLQDLRYAGRALRKRPGFTATAVFSLALGIGANTALFTLVNTVTWRMLPVRDPEGLVLLGQQRAGIRTNGISYQQFAQIRERVSALDLAAYSTVALNVMIDGQSDPTTDGQLVSGSYFSVLGIQPARGRLLTPDDDRVPMGHPVAVISDGYWKTRFARDPQIIGRQILLSGVPFSIVGVTPAEFFGMEVGNTAKIFVPVMMQPAVMPITENLLGNPNIYSSWLRSFGRLKPGRSAAQLASELGSISHEPEWTYRDKQTGATEQITLVTGSVATGVSDLRGQFSVPIVIVMVVVVIVLLIACANTGSLVLARSATRRPEFALRLALGASRSRLFRQVLAENILLAGLAGMCGTALAYFATRALMTYASAGRNPIALDLAPDGRVLLFTSVISVLAGLLFGCAPALRASRLDVTQIRQHDLANTRQGMKGGGPGKWLVVSQVALSLVLLIGAGLFVRSLQNLDGQEKSVDRDNVLIVRVEPRGSDQRGIPGTTDRLDGIYRALLDRIEHLPGVRSATLARTSPLTRFGYSARLTTAAREDISVPDLMMYPRYFTTMGIAITKGRDFNEDDLRADSPLVALVNESFVRTILKGAEPLGVSHGLTIRNVPLNIIGIVKDSRFPNLRETPTPVIYQTFRQTNTGRGQMVLHVRVAGQNDGLANQIRLAVQDIDRDVPTFQIRTLAAELDGVLIRERLIATLSGFFAIVALALVCVGLYGLMAFTVSLRTAEIGVRVALGATRSDVRWMIARQTLALVTIGIALGLPVAFALGLFTSREVTGVLFQLSPSDPITVAAATLLMVTVAMASGWLPARRAARIDPIVALRNE